MRTAGTTGKPKEDELPGKDELIAIGRAILNRDWNMVPEKLCGEWSTGYTTRGFMRARKRCSSRIVTLLESNPEKVVDAKNKVMIYIEGDGEKRVGQVRRKGETYWVHWFNK